jgi:dipeptidyl aminopeptidase/acylaminoacyl peptidase
MRRLVVQAHIDAEFKRKKITGKLLLIALSLGFFQALALPVFAAPLESGSSKKVITHDVYANWKGINGSVLSRDAKWAAYAIVAQEADGEVVIRQLSTAQEWRSPRGTAPSFSADGRYVAFAVQPTRAELDKAKKDKKKGDELPKPGLGIMDLSNGKLQTIERVKRFAWPEEGGNYLSVLLEPKELKKDAQKGDAKKDDTTKDAFLGAVTGEFDVDQQAGISGAPAAKKDVGSSFMLIDVANDQRQSFNDVAQFTWTKNGAWLAFTVVQNDASKDNKKDANKEIKTEATKESTEANKKANAESNKESNSEKNLNQKNIPIVDKTAVTGAEKSSEVQVSTSTEQATDGVKALGVTTLGVKALGVKALGVKTLTEGVYVINPTKGEPQALLRGRAAYKQLQFDEAGQQLAFVTDQPDQLRKTALAESAKKALSEKPENKADEKADGKADAKKDTKADAEDKTPAIFSLFLWQAGEANVSAIVHNETAGMRKNWAPSEFGALQFSKDGKRLFFGTAEMQKADPKDAPEPVKVDLWHWKDPELQSVQRVKAEKEKQRSYRAVVHLGQQPEQGRFVQLGTPEMPQVLVNENATVALGVSDLAYRQLLSWDSLYYDAYAIDLETGQARLLVKKLRFPPSMSPAGKYVFAFDAASSQWLAWRTNNGEKINLTAKLPTRFEDRSRDTPEPRSAYGSAGWTKDDASVILYDQFDLWEVSPTNLSAARNLTAGYGRKNNLELRYIDLDPEKRVPSEEPQAVVETKALPSEQWLLAATHENNRSTGFYSLHSTGSVPKKLIHADKQLAGVIKAKNADLLLFTQQSFVEFPDLWMSDLSFAAPQKISAANPQQAQFNWGTQEIIEYNNGDGKKLKALLAKPENFDPSKKYPMMVYIYEKMSDNLHRHVVPSPAQNINVTRYLSNGYIVLRPDIVYTTGYPGKSALKAVVPAVQKVISMGFVDPKRVGIQGHSWGAYQINYILTKTNIFRAAEAGASMANMVSGYGSIRWGTGLSRAFQYERGQSRIAGTPWDNTKLYLENSPIFSIDKVQTPYLTIHNDDDDAVPWYQAIEFFTALRRLGKEAYWFNYNGEKHGLRERDNMKHFTVHMAEFFDHYLLGSPRAEWMDKPVPYLERGKRDVMGQFKTKEEKVVTKE